MFHDKTKLITFIWYQKYWCFYINFVELKMSSCVLTFLVYLTSLIYFALVFSKRGQSLPMFHLKQLTLPVHLNKTNSPMWNFLCVFQYYIYNELFTYMALEKMYLPCMFSFFSLNLPVWPQNEISFLLWLSVRFCHLAGLSQG